MCAIALSTFFIAVLEQWVLIAKNKGNDRVFVALSTAMKKAKEDLRDLCVLQRSGREIRFFFVLPALMKVRRTSGQRILFSELKTYIMGLTQGRKEPR
jgi:hypothetical protein